MRKRAWRKIADTLVRIINQVSIKPSLLAKAKYLFILAEVLWVVFVFVVMVLPTPQASSNFPAACLGFVGAITIYAIRAGWRLWRNDVDLWN